MNNDQNKKKYPKGIFANKPFDNAPDFIKVNLSISKDILSEEYLQEYGEFINDKGYLKLQVLSGDKDYYTVIDTYKPKPKPEMTNDQRVASYRNAGMQLDNEEEVNPESIPW